MKTANARLRKLLWSVLDVSLALLPLIIFIITRWNQYLGTKEVNTVKFTNLIGFIFLMFFLGCIILKKTQILKGVVGFWTVTIILYCFKYCINDIVPIAFWSSVGMTLSKLITNPFVEKWKKIVDGTIIAEIQNVYQEKNTNKIVEAISKLNARG